MDLGLSGRRAIVCAASRGLGLACAEALAREGAAVTITGRDAARLEVALLAIRTAAPGADARAAVGDISTPEGRDAALAACPDPDILVTNNGGPPPGDFRNWSREDWIAAIDANMLAPIDMIRRTVDGMAARGFGRVVNITSSAVKSPIGPLGLSNGARSGLTGFVAGLARSVAGQGVTINNLLPGPFATDRIRAMSAAGRAIPIPPAGRLGDPAEFGAVCAFLCGVHTGYITGQNIVLDGGATPGAL
jgi:3-oxoacyl-[acyl-carrier protein] reductase